MSSTGEPAGNQASMVTTTRRILGDEHQDTLLAMSNLVEALRAQGDLPGAQALDAQIATIRRRENRDDGPTTV